MFFAWTVSHLQMVSGARSICSSANSVASVYINYHDYVIPRVQVYLYEFAL